MRPDVEALTAPAITRTMVPLVAFRKLNFAIALVERLGIAQASPKDASLLVRDEPGSQT